jgi:hypothetical protein
VGESESFGFDHIADIGWARGHTDPILHQAIISISDIGAEVGRRFSAGQ